MHRRFVLAAAGLTAAGLLTTAGFALAATTPVGPGTVGCINAGVKVGSDLLAMNAANAKVAQDKSKLATDQGKLTDAKAQLDRDQAALKLAGDDKTLKAKVSADQKAVTADQDAVKADQDKLADTATDPTAVVTTTAAHDKAVAAQHAACGTKPDDTKTVDLAGSPHAQVAKAPSGVNTGRA